MRHRVVLSVFAALCALLANATTLPAADVDSLASDLSAKDPKVRMAAIGELSRLGPLAEPAVPALVEALKVRDLAFRHEVVMTLGRIGPEAKPAVPGLTKFLGGESKILEHSAIHALRMIGDAKTAVPRLKMLAEGRDTNSAVAASWALAVLAPDADVTPLIPRLISSLSDNNQDVRNDAVMALAAIGKPAVQPLADEIGTKGPIVCWHAADALAEMGSLASPAVEKLVRTLDDKDDRVCWHAARALGSIGTKADLVVPALIAKLDGKGPLRDHSAIALGRFGDAAAPAVPKLLAMLTEENPNSRIIAARTLGNIGPKAAAAVPALDRALDDEFGAVTFAAADALGQIGKAAVPVLAKRLQDEDFNRLAASVLGTIGPDAIPAIPGLLGMLDSKERETRVEALLAIASMGPAAKEAAAPGLLKRLDNPRDEARAGAIYALTKLGDDRIVPTLAKLLPGEKDPRVKFAAAWSLVMFEPEDPEHVAVAMPLLQRALGDDWSLVRREAVLALSKLGSRAKPVAEDVLNLLGDEDPEVQAEALHTLTEIGIDGAMYVGPASKMVGSPDPAVRNTAVYALGKAGAAAKDAVPQLEQLFAESGEDVIGRTVSAWALVKIDPSEAHVKQALPLIVAALQFERREARLESAKLLGEIGGGSEAAIEGLKKATKDADAEVRAAAEAALKKIAS